MTYFPPITVITAGDHDAYVASVAVALIFLFPVPQFLHHLIILFGNSV